MASRKPILDKDSCLLWGRAAGRCEFEGCNKILHKDSYTLRPLNMADKAHIVANSPIGPRGNKKKSTQLATDIANIILLCKDCHKKIDSSPETFTIKKLLAMKSAHEQRCEHLTSLSENNKSHIITYAENIANQRISIDPQQAAQALIQDGKYPAESHPIDLSLIGNPMTDKKINFWIMEEFALTKNFEQKLKDRIAKTGDIKHCSLFGLAPIPLLIKLGVLFSDKVPMEVYQKHREPNTWQWLENKPTIEYKISKPAKNKNQIVLILSLSGKIAGSDIKKVLGNNVSIWQLSIENPNNDCIKTKGDLAEFRKIMRLLFDKMKAFHGVNKIINLFPAIPVSIAIEFGRVWMPKADLPLVIYDRNRANKLAFKKTLTIGGH